MAREPIEVLLTGATGFLGHYVLAELLAHPHIRCHVLLRPPVLESTTRLRRLLADFGLDLSKLIRDKRVIPVEGELPEHFDPSLLNGVDTIIHAAGNTCFDLNSDNEPIKTNVEGTRALLKAAGDANVRHFVQISTAYVCGRRTGKIQEDVDVNTSEFYNVYERSKWQAEQLTMQWANHGRTATICRPSILFGDSHHGRATNFNGIYIVARATEILRRATVDNPDLDRHDIPLRIAGDPDATSNLVPVDWVAKKITNIVLDHRLHGQVHHLTNPHPPSHAEIKQWLEDHYDVGGGVFCNDSFPLEKPNHYEELFYSLGNVVRDYFRRGLHFVSRTSSNRSGVQRLVSRDDFCQSLRFAEACHWGRSKRDSKINVSCDTEVDPRWYFEKFLPESVSRSSIALVYSLTIKVRFQVGSECEGWLCIFERGQLVDVLHGRNGVVEDFAYRLTRAAFTKIVSALEPLQVAFFRFEVEITGNMERALRMVPVMSQFIKEYPVQNACD